MRFLIVICIGAFLFSSCNKSTSKRGCTNKAAENYEASATVDCSCCFYDGRAFVYFSDSYKNNLVANGITNIYFFADGEKLEKKDSKISYFVSYSGNTTSIGSYKPYTYDTYGREHVVAVNMGNLKSKTVNLVVKSQQNQIIWADYVTLIAGQTILLELR